jgi:hypothetical protein
VNFLKFNLISPRTHSPDALCSLHALDKFETYGRKADDAPHDVRRHFNCIIGFSVEPRKRFLIARNDVC